MVRGLGRFVMEWVRTPEIGYGVPGGVALDDNLQLEVARAGSRAQGPHLRMERFEHAGPRPLGVPPPEEPLAPTEWDELTVQQDVVNAFLKSHAFGGLSYSLAKPLVFESRILSSPALFDPAGGQNVFVLAPEDVLYSESTYVRRLQGEEVVWNYDLRSQVMQIEGCACRTRRGVALIDVRTYPHRKLVPPPFYLCEGEYMHVAWLHENPDNVATALATITSEGEFALWDVYRRVCVFETRLPRGDLSGWARMFFVNNGLSLFWCGRYAACVLDLRTGERGPLIIDFRDRQEEIKAVCTATNGFLYVLISYQLLYIDAEKGSILLRVQQPLAANDFSLSLSFTEFKGADGETMHLVTISSLLTASLTCFTFSKTKTGRPQLLSDPYVLELWPNVLPQSHAGIQFSKTEITFYFKTETNGLFRAQCTFDNTNKPTTQIVSEAGLAKDADTEAKQSIERSKRASEFFNLTAADFYPSEVKLPSVFYNFSNYYKHAFAPAPPPAENTDEGRFEYLNFSSRSEFEKYLKGMWNPENNKYREGHIQHLLSDLAKFSTECGVKPAEFTGKQKLNKTTQRVLAKWPMESKTAHRSHKKKRKHK